MIITKEERQNNIYLKELYYKIIRTHSKIKDRVTNPNNTQWKDYGGRGVIMSSDWNTVTGFIKDIDSIPGWDEASYMKGLIEIDKDIKVPGNKIYSLDTCMWVTHKENMQVQPLRQTLFYAYNEYTGEIKSGTSRTKFAKENNLDTISLNGALHGRKHRVGNWWLWLASDNVPTPEIYTYIDKYGNRTWDVNKQRLSKKLGKNRAYISQLVSKGSNKVEITKVNLKDKIMLL